MATVSLSSSLSQNLSSLKATQSLMDETEYKLTTGKKVNSALDDPISYFTSAAHLDRASDLQTLKDDMGEAIQTIEAADDGITAIKDLISDAKAILQSALTAETDSDMAGYVSQYNEIMDDIDDLAEDSGYGDVNLLGGTSQTLDVVFDEDGESKVTLTGFDASTTGLSLTDATSGAFYTGTTAGGDFAVTKTGINALITELDTAKDTLRAKSKTLSTQLSVIETRSDFTDNLITTLEDGSANLVNADTTKEGVNLTTLQTQQQLAISSLSIANSASQAVLSLFS
ncbi:MAG: flagellin [Deltaproteobacteria bacterium]|nr:flagellin [Deltaproteobacteria bacterium]